MMVLPYETQEQSPLAPALGDGLGANPGAAQSPFASGFSGIGNDLISRLLPPIIPGSGSSGTNSGFGGLGGLGSGGFGLLTGLLTQIGQLISQLFGGGGSPGNGGSFGGNPEQLFGAANGGSVGDPHLSFNGQHWNDMSSQSDLLDSASFAGGFQLSTQATQPNQNGVTYNQSATISSNYGLNSVSMDNDGNTTIMQNGQQVSLGRGQTLDMGNGETVTANQDGSLQVLADDGTGGTINTTMRANGNGVDVTTNAQNVDLGGALVNGPGAQASPQPQPFPTPLPIPPGTIPPYGMNPPYGNPPNGWPHGPVPEPIRMNRDPIFEPQW